MLNSMNPYTNQAGLLEKHLGTGYQHVKAVSEALVDVRHLSNNMEQIHELYMAIPAMQAFVDNEDFLPWLQDNADNLEDLSQLLGDTLVTYAQLTELAEFSNFVRLGELAASKKEKYFNITNPIIGSSNAVVHELSADKIIGIHAVVHKLHGDIEVLGSVSGSVSRVWVDATHLRLEVHEDGSAYASRPVHVNLTYVP